MQKTIKNLVLTCVYFLSLLFALPTLAGNGQVATTADGIKYVTGGIGDEEATAMRGIAKDFSLNLVFSEGSGGKITGVNAVIYNEKGEVVFRIKGANPLLYVALPGGKYRVLASYEGQKQGFVFELDGKANKKLILNWKNDNEEDIKEDH